MKRLLIFLILITPTAPLICNDEIAGLKDALGNLNQQLKALTAGLEKLPKPTLTPTQQKFQAQLQEAQRELQKFTANSAAFQKTLAEFFAYDWKTAADAHEKNESIDKKQILRLSSKLTDAFETLTDSLPLEQIVALGAFVNKQNSPALIALFQNVSKQVQAVAQSFESAYSANTEKALDLTMLQNIGADEEDPDPVEVLLNIKNDMEALSLGAQKLTSIVVPYLETNNTQPFEKELAAAQQSHRAINQSFTALFEKMTQFSKILGEINRGNLDPKQYKRTQTNELKSSLIQTMENLEPHANQLFETLKALQIYASYLPTAQLVDAWIKLVNALEAEIARIERTIDQNAETYIDYKQDPTIKRYLETKEYGPKQEESFDELLTEFDQYVEREIEMLNLTAIKLSLEEQQAALKREREGGQ